MEILPYYKNQEDLFIVGIQPTSIEVTKKPCPIQCL